MGSPQPKPALTFPSSSRDILSSYLPSTSTAPASTKPFLTLTFATSLDSSLSLAPGTQTVLSGPETKAMTHYLRSQHDAILVGVGTAIADNPALNCRIEGVGLEGQPRPIIIDPKGRWDVEGKDGIVKECLKLAKEGKGKFPWIITNVEYKDELVSKKKAIEDAGALMLRAMPEVNGQAGLGWASILQVLAAQNIKSIMIEGGGHVINTLLQERNLHLIDSVIVTIAPVWLGEGGVVVSPPARTNQEGNRIPAARLHETKWQQFGDDVVMCGRVKQ